MRAAATVLFVMCCSLGAAAAQTTSVPYTLAQADVLEGMRAVSPAVRTCGDASEVKLTFKVKVVVSPKGKVTSATVQTDELDDTTKACVEDAVKQARFKPSKIGLTFTYPFVFR